MRLILPISFIVIIIALFFAFINPTYKDIKQMKTDMATYSLALDNSSELQKTRDLLVDSYKNIKKEDKDRLEHMLPSTINNIDLILEIEKIANLHGLPVRDIKFDTKKLEPDSNGEANSGNIVAEYDPADRLPYGIFPMEFIIEGRYETFVSFLKDLEFNLRLVDIKDISFTVPAQDDKKGNSDIYSYTLKVETYWLK